MVCVYVSLLPRRIERIIVGHVGPIEFVNAKATPPTRMDVLYESCKALF